MKVHRSPAKMIGLAFLSLLMTALALFVGFTGYQKEGAGGFPVFIGIIGGLFFLLAFIAIPLESLIHSARTVGGVLLAALVSTLALVLRVAGTVVRRLARVLITVYDVAIVIPLLLERLTKSGLAMKRTAIDVDDSAHQAR